MIYKRGNVYWFKFVYNGVQYRGSTRLTHKAEAMRVEARKKTEIIMGKTRKEAPDFSKFVGVLAEVWIDSRVSGNRCKWP